MFRHLMTAAALLSLLLLTLSLPWVAWADDDNEPSVYSEESTYVSIGAAFASETFSSTFGTDRAADSELADIRQSDNTGALSFRLGKRATPMFGWEINYEPVIGFRVKTPNETRTFDVHLITFNLKIYGLQPILDNVLDGRIQPYASFGAGYMQLKGSGIETAIDLSLRYSLGSDFHISERVSLYFEAAYVHSPTQNLRGVDYWLPGAGVTYHFE